MNDNDYFEVLLDLSSFAIGEPSKKYDKSYQFEFFVEDVRFSELGNCKVGDYVKFWEAPNDNRMIIYRKGTVGGSGKLGYVPSENVDKIKGAYAYKTEVVDIQPDSCKILCTIYSEEEHKKLTEKENIKETAKEGDNLSEELHKKYTPRKPISCDFEIINYDLLKISSFLKLGIKDKEYYLQNPFNLEIDLLDDKGNVVGTISEHENNQRDKIKRILKAHYNNLNFDIKVGLKSSPEAIYKKGIVEITAIK